MGGFQWDCTGGCRRDCIDLGQTVGKTRASMRNPCCISQEYIEPTSATPNTAVLSGHNATACTRVYVRKPLFSATLRDSQCSRKAAGNKRAHMVLHQEAVVQGRSRSASNRGRAVVRLCSGRQWLKFGCLWMILPQHGPSTEPSNGAMAQIPPLWLRPLQLRGDPKPQNGHKLSPTEPLTGTMDKTRIYWASLRDSEHIHTTTTTPHTHAHKQQNNMTV